MDLLIHMTRQDLRNELNQFAETFRENKPENNATKEPEYLTRKETASKLHISLVTLNRLTNNGILQSFKIGGRVLYKSVEINKAISENLKKYRR